MSGAVSARQELEAAMQAAELRMHEELMFFGDELGHLTPPEDLAKLQRSADALADAIALVRQRWHLSVLDG